MLAPHSDVRLTLQTYTDSGGGERLKALEGEGPTRHAGGTFVALEDAHLMSAPRPGRLAEPARGDPRRDRGEGPCVRPQVSQPTRLADSPLIGEPLNGTKMREDA